MITHDALLLPPHTPPGRGRVKWGMPQVFLPTLIASAGEDNIIISCCSLQSTQLVNNKPGWTEACEGAANPGIILLLLLLFAHYFSSSLFKDNQLNYFYPIVFFHHIGQFSSECKKHLELILLFFLACLFLSLDLFTAHKASHTVNVSVSRCSNCEHNYE